MISRVLHRAKQPTTQPVAPIITGPWPFSTEVLDAFGAVTEEQALDLPVVSGTIAICSSLVAQMPLEAFAGAVEVPTPPVLRNPAPGGNRVLADWLGEYVRDISLYGNYLAILGDLAWDGWPSMMYPVPFGQWFINPDGTYQVGADNYAATDVFHVRVKCRTGEQYGRGLLETHRRLLAGAIAAEQWAQAYYSGGTSPPVVLTSADPELTQQKADALKGGLRNATRRREAVVVPSGTTVTALNAPADAAQLIESRRWGAQQLAQALGIPAVLLGLDSPSLTYRNIQDVFSQFVSSTVMGLVVPLEQQLTSQCLPRTLTARFDPSAVLRPDLASRVNVAVQGLAGGVFTSDEARDLLDLGPAGPDALQSPPVTPPGTPVVMPDNMPALSVVPKVAP
jgi:HK97 family phage portal protein